MGRLIFVPQFPSQLRYQEWFFTEFQKQLKNHFDVLVLGQSFASLLGSIQARSQKHMFSPIRDSMTMEFNQIHEFLDLRVYEDDILLVMDLSFPGFFSNVLYHKPVKNAFAYCHATSKNSHDYFAPVRKSKWLVETGHSKLFKKIFVATEYHKKKLAWKNIEVIGLPDTPFVGFNLQKQYDIISVARPSNQKITKKIESEIEKVFGKIQRANCSLWGDYYKFLSEGKVLLSTAKDEAFGYQILEAIKNNSIPVAPDRFSYPELLPKKYLYKNIEQLKEIIRLALDGKLEVPQLVNHNLVSSFFENICSIMKRESNA